MVFECCKTIDTGTDLCKTCKNYVTNRQIKNKGNSILTTLDA